MIVNQEQNYTIPVRVPGLDFRAELNGIVKRYAEKRGYPYRHVWNIYYSALHDHLHFDVRDIAAELKMRPLDYIEQKRLADIAIHVAGEIFGHWL